MIVRRTLQQRRAAKDLYPHFFGGARLHNAPIGAVSANDGKPDDIRCLERGEPGEACHVQYLDYT